MIITSLVDFVDIERFYFHVLGLSDFLNVVIEILVTFEVMFGIIG